MPRTRAPYSLEFRQQMVELVRAGRTPEELSRDSQDAWPRRTNPFQRETGPSEPREPAAPVLPVRIAVAAGARRASSGTLFGNRGPFL